MALYIITLWFVMINNGKRLLLFPQTAQWMGQLGKQPGVYTAFTII